MAGFLYYVQQPGILTLDDINNLGLRYAFDAAPSCATVEGPDGKRGIMFADVARPSAPGISYSAKTQAWRKIPQSPAAQVWVGHLINDPPTPSILQRREMLPGHKVTLADGRDWMIPTARHFVEENGEVGWNVSLPQQVELDDDGVFIVGNVQAKYRKLWSISEEFAARMGNEINAAGGNDVQFDLQQYFKDAITAIQTNYHVGPAELAMLGALSVECVSNVMLALIDWFTFLELLEKKKRSAGSHSDDGNSAELMATNQRLAS
jgi:hypothetical protein